MSLFKRGHLVEHEAQPFSGYCVLGLICVHVFFIYIYIYFNAAFRNAFGKKKINAQKSVMSVRGDSVCV